jgi:hypothetical protein
MCISLTSHTQKRRHHIALALDPSVEANMLKESNEQAHSTRPLRFHTLHWVSAHEVTIYTNADELLISRCDKCAACGQGGRESEVPGGGGRGGQGRKGRFARQHSNAVFVN